MERKERTDVHHLVRPDIEELYRSYRKYAFAIAYRMLGTVADAEDVVQDCFVELQHKQREEIRDSKAYIAKVTVNRCLNLLNSARKQRETYVGEWLPEPLGGSGDTPEEVIEQKDMISYAFLVMLERLAPTERAIFVLREAFQYEYKDIAELMGKSESNCRQIFSRARRNLPPEMSADDGGGTTSSRELLLERFAGAFLAYDVSTMLELLADNPVFISDGGGSVHTVMRPMVGHKGVLALLTSRRVLTRLREKKLVRVVINGEVHLGFVEQGMVTDALCFGLTPTGDRIQNFYLVVNPDKLNHINVLNEDLR